MYIETPELHAKMSIVCRAQRAPCGPAKTRIWTAEKQSLEQAIHLWNIYAKSGRHVSIFDEYWWTFSRFLSYKCDDDRQLECSNNGGTRWAPSPVISRRGPFHSIYRGETTPVKPSYFRPFTGATGYPCHSIYNDHLRAPVARPKNFRFPHRTCGLVGICIKG